MTFKTTMYRFLKGTGHEIDVAADGPITSVITHASGGGLDFGNQERPCLLVVNDDVRSSE